LLLIFNLFYYSIATKAIKSSTNKLNTMSNNVMYLFELDYYLILLVVSNVLVTSRFKILTC